MDMWTVLDDVSGLKGQKHIPYLFDDACFSQSQTVAYKVFVRSPFLQ